MDCKFARIERIGMVSSTAAPPSGGRRIHLPCGPTPPPCLGVKLVRLVRSVRLVKLVRIAKLVRLVRLVKLVRLG